MASKDFLWRLSLIFLLSPTGHPQTTEAERANLPKSFHDEVLNATYYYPPHFTSEPPAATEGFNCLQTRLVARSHLASSLSSFAVSTMDASCPNGLPGSASLGVFVRRQLLAELATQGEVKILREPTRYFIDGHTAMVTFAAVTTHKPERKTDETTYAAKGCALDDHDGKRHRKATGPINRVLCFDFTTQNSDLVNLMFSFVIQFGDDAPEPLFPGSLRPQN